MARTSVRWLPISALRCGFPDPGYLQSRPGITFDPSQYFVSGPLTPILALIDNRARKRWDTQPTENIETEECPGISPGNTIPRDPNISRTAYARKVVKNDAYTRYSNSAHCADRQFYPAISDPSWIAGYPLRLKGEGSAES